MTIDGLRGRIRGRLLVGLVAVGAAGGVLGRCARNPVTGQREISLISESQEIEMGRDAAKDVVRTIGLVQDSALQAYVSSVGLRLARDTERPNLPWSFAVVEDPTPNAFALPGGFIFITRGLMDLMDSEAELATVLGHEIGHVTAKHSVNQMSKAQLAQLGLGIGMILVPELQNFGQAAGAGLQLLFLKYSRDDERQADDLGFRYALAQGYDVREMTDVFAALEKVGEMEGQSPLPSWMSTHPYPQERIQRINDRLASTTLPANLVENRDPYLRQISGLVYGDNPRNGFFRDGVFYHPDLRFRIDFPRGWTTQNLSEAVSAASPQQDAAIQLTLASGDAASAARQFAAQQGIEAGTLNQQSIHGLSAATLPFQASTQQGALAGIAAFVEYGGSTYQILGYAPAGAYSAYDTVFRSALGSFQPLTDPQILAVRPNRLEVVQIPSSMTLADFDRRYPSIIGMDELALINQVEGSSAMLNGGMLVKRVVSG